MRPLWAPFTDHQVRAATSGQAMSRPSNVYLRLTCRVSKHGAAPLQAFSCGLGKVIPCPPMTPGGARTPAQAPPLAPFLRGRTESAPANLEDDMSMGSLDDSIGGSRMSMSSIDESDSSAGTLSSVGSPRSTSSALRSSRRAKKKCLRVSFAAQLAVHIGHSADHEVDNRDSSTGDRSTHALGQRFTATPNLPTPVPEECAVEPGGQRVSPDIDEGRDSSDMGDSDDSPSSASSLGVPGLHIALPDGAVTGSYDEDLPGFNSAPSFGGANPFASAPMTAPAAVGRRYWSDEAPAWSGTLTPLGFSPRTTSASSAVRGGSARHSPVVKRKRVSDVPLEDSCDADAEDGFDASADGLPAGDDDL